MIEQFTEDNTTFSFIKSYSIFHSKCSYFQTYNAFSDEVLLRNTVSKIRESRVAALFSVHKNVWMNSNLYKANSVGIQEEIDLTDALPTMYTLLPWKEAHSS